MVAKVLYAAAGVRLIASQLVAEGVQVCLLAAAAVAGAGSVGVMGYARLHLEMVTQTLPLSACPALAWTSESRLTCLLLQAPDHLRA